MACAWVFPRDACPRRSWSNTRTAPEAGEAIDTLVRGVVQQADGEQGCLARYPFEKAQAGQPGLVRD